MPPARGGTHAESDGAADDSESRARPYAGPSHESPSSRDHSPPPPDEVPLRATGLEPEAPLSFKRRSRKDSLNAVRSWLRTGRERLSALENPHLRHLRDHSEGWEHPARYVNASHVTVPSVLPTPESNPIPLLPYTVLCLLIFGEFCSAGVAGPFLFFMLEDFQVGDESQVGFWAGILAAVFFFAQFLTSLLWSSAAEKYGRRTVLQVSLVGSTLSLFAYGLSPNLTCALLFRGAQGFFNGAVGVAKGAVRDLTDETNESRAYAQMGFCWGMGGIVGPILGGLLEHPAQKYGWLFGRSQLLHRYPYMLPCTVAASFTAIGALLSVFLEPHAGPKQLRLPDDDALSITGDDGWRSHSTNTPEEELNEHEALSTYSLPTASSSHISRGRRAHHEAAPSAARSQSRAGTAYGAGSTNRGVSSEGVAHHMSGVALRRPGRRPSFATGGRSYFAPSIDMEMSSSHHRDSNMSLMERFVLANDDALLSVTDLWVAAATHGDDAHSLTDTGPTHADHEDNESVLDHAHAAEYHDTPPLFGTSFGPSDREQERGEQAYLPPAHFQRLHRPLSQAQRSAKTPEPEDMPVEPVPEAPVPTSLWALIPVVVVAHYATVSFHSSTFDQVFLAFLVTPEPSGGLGLNAGHYAILIASMSVCQLYFQFRLYPSVGPPNGPLSHLAMLQTGLMLYLPCYLLFPFLRTFLLPNTDALVMVAMIAFATLRWLANVCTFTAISVLLNAWTPAHLVPLANGLAQTVSSAARCTGPIVGGMVWAKSIQGGPTAHPWPFNYFLGFVIVGLVAMFQALQARWLRDRS
ncbi:hypothetical protein MOBT1_001004 [Malassezia obtusa]|uniref:Uncharacterized protein n=1 Tax=Malassezia obtusa TaxID=76774 RepID=A0AAF0E2F9_9BASI|nr:hypothetical protein MOBT1_001004 [Malassezia obtusa]